MDLWDDADALGSVKIRAVRVIRVPRRGRAGLINMASEFEKIDLNNELIRTETNSSSVSSY
jgi:hypothetical protein